MANFTKKPIVQNCDDLAVFQAAQKLLIDGYQFTRLLPAEERYNRIQQLRRSLSSVPANIAEGFGRHHHKENLQFCRQARGSLEESYAHVLAAQDLEKVSAEECERLNKLNREVCKILNGYIRYLATKAQNRN